MNKPIKVLQVMGNLNIGGAETFILNVLRAIDRESVNFDFVVHGDSDGDYSDEINHLGCNIFHCPKFKGSNYFKYKSWWKKFFTDHKGKYQILHSHSRSTASIYIPLAKKEEIKTIIHSHSTSETRDIEFWVKRILEFPLRYQADYMFACSTDAGKWLYGDTATRKQNYYLIPNCIDVNKFDFNAESRRKIRNQYGISETDFVIGHVGSYRTAKNHEFIIETFAKLKEIQPNAVLLSVGIGDRFEMIQRLCSDKGLENSVIFAGNQHNIEEYYSAMDCFFFPSIWEGLPVSVVEAQASGIPCLISDTITKDVFLTNLITTMSLEDSMDNWIKKLVEYSTKERLGISECQKERLMSFDSMEVSHWMQEFYLKQISG